MVFSGETKKQPNLDDLFKPAVEFMKTFGVDLSENPLKYYPPVATRDDLLLSRSRVPDLPPIPTSLGPKDVPEVLKKSPRKGKRQRSISEIVNIEWYGNYE
jgi:hypothetical protein